MDQIEKFKEECKRLGGKVENEGDKLFCKIGYGGDENGHNEEQQREV